MKITNEYYQWKWPMDITNENYQWILPMNITNEDYQWILPMKITDEYFQWKLPMDITNENGQWILPMKITNENYQWILPRQHAATIGGAAMAISCLMVKTKLNQTTSPTLMPALWKPKLNFTFWIVKTAPERLSHHIVTYIIIFPVDIWISLVDFQVDASGPILHFPTQSAVHFLPRPMPFQAPHLLLPAQSWLPWSVGRGVAPLPPLASQLYFSNGCSVSLWVAPTFAFAHTYDGFTFQTPPFIHGRRGCVEEFLKIFDKF